ncbi:hypothetical protein JHK87_052510 [Glycine soja]|nr:hypothetical protein JHK87_052510 [Glycine soja]
MKCPHCRSSLQQQWLTLLLREGVALWLMKVESLVEDSKRLIGRKYSDPVIQKEKMLWPFKVVAGINDKPMIIVKYKGQEKHLCVEEVSSMVFT